MRSIEQLDKNFEVKTAIEESLFFTNCLKAPFQVCGLISTQDGFVRMPSAAALHINSNIAALHKNTAGGRLRFRTNSPDIAIRAKMAAISKMPHFPLTGTAGFDLYEDNIYRGTFIPPYDMEDGYESIIHLYSQYEREILIHFPLYSDVISLEIGLCQQASLLPPIPYCAKPPVVYYGSSITQGGCASRPGNSYENILSRALNIDHINLGFSGGAKGEEAMAEYISGLSMSAFVYDYDHNAPNIQHLRDTHPNMFSIIRAAKPLLPVIMLSRPQPNPSGEEKLRRSIILNTWQNAVVSGDKNVYFIDGSMMLHAFGGDCGTVDAIHPNDLGFMCMAKFLEPILQKILF